MFGAIRAKAASKRPPIFIGAASTSASTSSPTGVVIPAGVLPGDLLVSFFHNGSGSSTCSAPTGWSTVYSSGGRSASFYKIAVAGDAGSTVGFPWTGGGSVIVAVVAFRGCNQASPLDGVGGGVYQASSGGVISWPTEYVSGNNELVLISTAENASTPSASGDSTLTQRVNVTDAFSNVLQVWSDVLTPHPSSGHSPAYTSTQSAYGYPFTATFKSA